MSGKAQPHEQLPDAIGAFRIEGILGRGGMGVVYRAARDDGTPAALKVVRVRDLEDRDSYLRRFERESGIRIDHPNIVRVLDAGTDDEGDPWIAFELLEGESLWQRNRRGTLSPDEARDIAVQACRGLAEAHRHGVVHRDLKPGNLFLCADGSVKLLDFGIARVSDAESNLTMGRILGTPAYLAPEQARGEEDVDLRADIWALGVVLYEAISGRRPFKGDSALGTMMQVVLDEPIPLGVQAPKVPGKLEAVVHRCLRKQRGERFADAEALREALEAVDAKGVAAQPALEEPLEAPADLTDEATRTARSTPSALTMPLDERRLVAIVLGQGVSDAATFREHVEQRGGIFIPLVGRRAIGVFGGSAWEGDEVVRAASAALLSRGCASWVSIASGRGQRKGQSISGDVLDAAEAGCAAQVEGVAAPKETIRALGGGFSYRSAGALYELTAERAPYWPLDLDEQVDGPLLAREHEMEQLARMLEQTISEGTANAAVVVGGAGTGKSRLRRELESRIEEHSEEVKMLTARCDPRKRETALSLMAVALTGRARLGAMLRGWPRIDAEASAEERRRGVRALVDDARLDDMRAQECAEFLGELLGVPMAESEALRAARRDPQLMADRLHLAVKDWMTGACERGPVALLVEDLQWADDASVQLLGELLDDLAFSPLLLFATGRPEMEARWPGLFSDRGAVRLQLAGLRPADVGRLAAEIAGRTLPPKLLRAIVARTEGNPLFVTEIVRALLEDGRIDDDVEDLPLPVNVEGAVQSRLDHLQQQHKELCKRMSIYGRPVMASEIEALGIAEPARMFAELGRRELVNARPRSRGSEREYAFRTPLVGEVAYRMMSDAVRRDLHARAAVFLSGRPEPDDEEVAEHYERGGELEAAAIRYAEATFAAERRGDSATVLRCADRALELGAPEQERYRLQMARADALRFTGRRKEQAEVLDVARQLTTSHDELARTLVEQAVCMSRTGRMSEALVQAEHAVDQAREADEPELIALCLGRQANLLTFAGELDRAAELLEQTRRLALDAPAHLRALIAEWRGLHANARADLGAQMTAFREAARLYEETGDVRRAAGAGNNVADAYNRVGAWADAERALRATVLSCRRVGNRLIEGYALLNLAYSLWKQGLLDKAFESLDQAAALAEANSDVRLSVFVRLYRARAIIESGSGRRDELSRAVELAQEAADEADGLGLPSTRVVALAVTAKARLALGEPERALELSTAGMELREQLGGTEEDEAELFVAHAAALDTLGRPEEAERTREQGRARLQEVAARIADDDLRTRFLRDVPAHRALMA